MDFISTVNKSAGYCERMEVVKLLVFKEHDN